MTRAMMISMGGILLSSPVRAFVPEHMGGSHRAHTRHNHAARVYAVHKDKRRPDLSHETLQNRSVSLIG